MSGTARARRRRCAAWAPTLLALLALAGGAARAAAADGLRPFDSVRGSAADLAQGLRPPGLAPARQLLAAIPDEVLPTVPMGPSRALHTALVMPPVPWLLTEGDAGTPRGGRLSLNVTRLSDERQYRDALGNTFTFDGEEQFVTLEWVSPRRHAHVAGHDVPFHLAASLSAITMNQDLLDGARNWAEENLFFGGAEFIAGRQRRGRALTRSGPGGRFELLETDPLFKVRGALKVPLCDRPLGAHRLSSAWSLSVTSPSFGSHAESGNEAPQVDTTLALAWPVARHFRLTGAANLALPGASERLASFGIPHRTLVPSGLVQLEYWPTARFAIALGFESNGAYTIDTSAPTDLASYYLNVGLLWRPSCRSEIHLVWSENPTGGIEQNGLPTSSYPFSVQRDADFSLTLGGSLTL